MVVWMGWPTRPVDSSLVPYRAMMGRGVVLRNNLPGDYPYEVALDSINLGPKLVGNCYIYREEEVRRAEP